nr:MAG TPA: hypothetical protein [Caudoviricetes sp.]
MLKIMLNLLLLITMQNGKLEEDVWLEDLDQNFRKFKVQFQLSKEVKMN